MKPEIKAKWVAALRSGQFNQGMGALRRGDSYCCLGVLCHLAVEEGVIPGPIAGTFHPDPGMYVYGADAYEGKAAYLPHDVVVWAGLDSASPRFRSPTGELEDLARLNDVGTPFSQIAATIEKHF